MSERVCVCMRVCVCVQGPDVALLTEPGKALPADGMGGPSEM